MKLFSRIIEIISCYKWFAELHDLLFIVFGIGYYLSCLCLEIKLTERVECVHLRSTVMPFAQFPEPLGLKITYVSIRLPGLCYCYLHYISHFSHLNLK